MLISTPYISEQQKYIKEYKKNKNKWINKNDFSKYVDKASANRGLYIPNYVSMTPSDPPANYKFRNISKDKWISPKNFCI